jgi:hypothetical protein
MGAVILDLNDCQLRLWRDGATLFSSPGYALLQGKHYVFGEDARKQARLHPRSINHRFWWQLDTEPMNPAFGPGRHTADLVHAHLLDIHQQAQQTDQLILAAPGSMQTGQLALLLGIIEQCPFSAVGLVDRAVASCAAQAVSGSYGHIDLQLHQALVTHLELDNGVLQRRLATPVPGCGWLAIQDRMAQSIADSFIRQTRFDPRRQATIEQQLYDALPDLMRALLEEQEYNLELGGHRARLERQTLAESCSDLLQRIAQSASKAGTQFSVESLLAMIPGVAEQLGPVEVLPENALFENIERNQQMLEGDDSGLHFVTRLPASAAEPAQNPQPPPAPVQQDAPEPATEPSRYRIEIEEDSCTVLPVSGPAPRINGEPVSEARRLQPGDRLQLDSGEVLTLEPAVGDHGP